MCVLFNLAMLDVVCCCREFIPLQIVIVLFTRFPADMFRVLNSPSLERTIVLMDTFPRHCLCVSYTVTCWLKCTKQRLMPTQHQPGAPCLYLEVGPLFFFSLFFLFFFLLTFDFCRFYMVIRFFHPPPQRPMASDFEGFSIPDFIHFIYFPILILEKEPVFSLLNVHC